MAESSEQFRDQSRLPRFAKPLRYDLVLRPDLAAYTFFGSASAAVSMSVPTRFLVLNVAELAVDRLSWQGYVGVVLQDWAPTEVLQFEEDQILVLGFVRELPPGEGVLTMDFTGTLKDQMGGFYRRYIGVLYASEMMMIWSRSNPSYTDAPVTMENQKVMMGTFSPQQEPYTYKAEEDSTPSDIFARGSYSARLKFVDDDGKVYQDMSYGFEIRKDWLALPN
ncbi:Puromycin-sensitive aminopeptidase [Hordeum vulgare]|nr:Puromycin-sensitive aminopeptidase [Hordeum vulgare]